MGGGTTALDQGGRFLSRCTKRKETRIYCDTGRDRKWDGTCKNVSGGTPHEEEEGTQGFEKNPAIKNGSSKEKGIDGGRRESGGLS